MTGTRTDKSRGPVRRPWRFDLVLQRDGEVSLETQLTRAFIREIQRGRLPPGSMLPGSRTLAEQLGVNRKVVVACVDELVSQGWLETIPATGTRVTATLPALAVADANVRARKVVVPRAASPLVTITDGLPDARLAPLAELGRAYRRALRTIGGTPSGYVDPAGDPGLRELLAEFVNQARGLSTTTEEVFLTRGSQGALALYALSMLAPGDVVGVETPGYAPAWRAFEFARARVVHVPVDADGLDTSALEEKARSLSGRLRAVYVTPHHQYPTSVSMTPERRLHLLRLVASPECVRKLRDTRTTLERQGDPILERAIAELFEDDVIQRHARRARRVYEGRLCRRTKCRSWFLNHSTSPIIARPGAREGQRPLRRGQLQQRRALISARSTPTSPRCRRGALLAPNGRWTPISSTDHSDRTAIPWRGIVVLLLIDVLDQVRAEKHGAELSSQVQQQSADVVIVEPCFAPRKLGA